MGSGLVLPSGDPEGRLAKIVTAKHIDASLEKESRQDEEKIKLLLLGAGESGKSTIFKQMKIIYGTQFSEEERKLQINPIHGNIIVAMRTMIQQAAAWSQLTDVPESLAPHLDTISKLKEHDHLTPELGSALAAVWEYPVIQSVWGRRHEFQVIESLHYFMSRIHIITADDYLPNQEDLLHNRVRTSGIVTERYAIDSALFEMYDVGGQRNERRKWIHCFEAVTAIIFVVAVSEFDQVLFEDNKTNRLMEAIALFEEICNNPYFEDSSMILFFNKSDLFRSKIRAKSLSSVPQFSDYTGAENDVDASMQYIVNRFLHVDKSVGKRKLYYHVTCATDTRNIQVVFNSCKDIVLRENIERTRAFEQQGGNNGVMV